MQHTAKKSRPSTSKMTMQESQHTAKCSTALNIITKCPRKRHSTQRNVTQCPKQHTKKRIERDKARTQWKTATRETQKCTQPAREKNNTTLAQKVTVTHGDYRALAP